MKKIFIILAVALSSLIISSCEKDSEEGPDLTKDIIGTYTGDLQLKNDNGTNLLTGLTIEITKVDNSTVKVEPSGQDVTLTFTATLTEASDGVAMKIIEQDIFGGTVKGYTQNNEYPDIHGGLTSEVTDKNPFFYSLQVDLSGYEEYRVFLGAPSN